MKCLKWIFWAFPVVVGSLFCLAQSDYFEQRFDPDRIDAEEGRQRVLAFRNFRYQGDYSLQFHLIHMSRKGGQEFYRGTLWGGWNAQGPITRVELKSPRNGKLIRLIVQNGPAAKIWLWEEGGKVEELEQKNWFNPLFDGTVYTAFDLSLAFLFWDNFVYQGPKRVKGRPTQTFVMQAPAEFAKNNPGFGGVYIAMDASYNFLVQAQLLNREGQVIKFINLNDFKKVGDEYIIKQLDVLDEVTHDKTRFEVNGAAMNLKIDPKFFLPESLNGENPKISSENYYFFQ